MDIKNFYKKLAEISLDTPTEFPRTQCLNKPISYRECCIDYVKKTMRCVGYRDYLVAELEKLDKVEQIVNKSYTEDEFYNVVQDIKEVLEQE